MDDPQAEKIARNNSVFRDANEEIAAAAFEFGLSAETTSPFFCECSDPRCLRIVRVTLEDYRHVRSDARRFLHAPDHEIEVDRAVRLVEERDGYTIVEKIGEAGDRAAKLRED
jgi:hypothetical protein